jgi:hypothetical protein
MIAVAVAALVIGLTVGAGVLLKRRRAYFLLLAQAHQNEVTSSTARREALKLRFGHTSGMGNEEIMRLYRDYDRMMDRADHHAAMAAKYLQVARYPWLPVAPDPPEPD